jgi:hypothetical protein
MSERPKTTLRDRNCARDVRGSESAEEAAETMAAIRWVAHQEGYAAGLEAGRAEALAHLRKNWGAYSVIGVAVDEAERALAKGQAADQRLGKQVAT